MDTAARWVAPTELGVIHRFRREVVNEAGAAEVVTDAAYGELSLAMRERASAAAVAASLAAAGHVVVHDSAGAAVESIAAEVSGAAGRVGEVAVTVATNEAARELSAAIRAHRVGAGVVDDALVALGREGARVGVGDRVVTRRNDRDLGVANRDAWTVGAVDADGSLAVAEGRRAAVLPAGYVASQVELGYATTDYGAQGMTTRTAHVLVGGATTAGGLYVGATRGRDANVVHVVAPDLDAAVDEVAAALGRDRTDRGLDVARDQAAAGAQRLFPPAAPEPAAPEPTVPQPTVPQPTAPPGQPTPEPEAGRGRAVPSPATWVTAVDVGQARANAGRVLAAELARIEGDLAAVAVPAVPDAEAAASADRSDRSAIATAEAAVASGEARAAAFDAAAVGGVGEWLAERDTQGVLAAGRGRFGRRAPPFDDAQGAHSAWAARWTGWDGPALTMTDAQAAGLLVAQAERGAHQGRQDAGAARAAIDAARRSLDERAASIRHAHDLAAANEARAAQRVELAGRARRRAEATLATVDATVAARATWGPDRLAAADRAAVAWRADPDSGPAPTPSPDPGPEAAGVVPGPGLAPTAPGVPVPAVGAGRPAARDAREVGDAAAAYPPLTVPVPVPVPAGVERGDGERGGWRTQSELDAIGARIALDLKAQLADLAPVPALGDAEWAQANAAERGAAEAERQAAAGNRREAARLVAARAETVEAARADFFVARGDAKTVEAGPGLFQLKTARVDAARARLADVARRWEADRLPTRTWSDTAVAATAAQAADRVVERQVRDRAHRADRADRAAGDIDRNVAERDRAQHGARATNQARAAGRDEALARVGARRVALGALQATRDQDITAMTPREVAGADQDRQAVIDRGREQARQAVLQRQAAEQERVMERHTRAHDYHRSHGPHRPGPDREGPGLGM